MKYIWIFVFIFSQLAWSIEDTVKPSGFIKKECANKKNPEQCENDSITLLEMLLTFNNVIKETCANQENQEQCRKTAMHILTHQSGKLTGIRHNFSNASQSVKEHLIQTIALYEDDHERNSSQPIRTTR